MTWFRILVLSLLVMALAMPMRLHGLMAMPDHAAGSHAHGAGHAPDQPGQPALAAIPCHETEHVAGLEAARSHHALADDLMPVPVDTPERPVTSGGHASLHCAAAGLVVPNRLVDLPLPRLAMFETLAPTEMLLTEGMAPPRQERPPRTRS